MCDKKKHNSSIFAKPNDKGTHVEIVQKLLAVHGIFPVDEVDGVYDQDTALLVSVFQHSKQLNVDGIVGYETLRALCDKIDGVYGFHAFIALVPNRLTEDDLSEIAGFLNPVNHSKPNNGNDKKFLALGSTGHSVITLQKILTDLNLLNHVDGIFGKRTKTAVKAIQAVTGLDVDGIVGPDTADKLMSCIKNLKVKNVCKHIHVELEQFHTEFCVTKTNPDQQ